MIHIAIATGPSEEREWSNSNGSTLPKSREHNWEGMLHGIIDMIFVTQVYIMFVIDYLP